MRHENIKITTETVNQLAIHSRDEFSRMDQNNVSNITGVDYASLAGRYTLFVVIGHMFETDPIREAIIRVIRAGDPHSIVMDDGTKATVLPPRELL
jgi:hypothetical protein